MSEESTPKVYAAISAVMRDIAKDGISKSRSNTQQGYKFRGIDDVHNALAPVMSAHGLCVLPRVLRREVTEKVTQKGGILFYVVLDVEFDFVCAEDGSKHVVAVIGEAMDSADKATNKAMSAAYKYACIQAFCIPTEAAPDADQTTHEVAAKYDIRPWLESIEAADISGLNDISAELAREVMPASDKSALRTAFSARKATLKAAP